jgi:ferric-dicitrate binding protein FerR (iron transport regulator)
MAFNRGKIGEARMADGFTGPSYFVPELDGDTAPTRRLAAQWAQEKADAEAEAAAEAAIERHYETNDQYRWEVERDERIAVETGGYAPWFR